MASMQQPAPGSKSSKFVNVNPLDPFVRPFENEAGPASSTSGSTSAENSVLAENLNRRLEEHVLQRRWLQDQQQQQQQQELEQQSAAAGTIPDSRTATKPPLSRPWVERDGGTDSDSDLDDDDDDPALAALRERRLEQIRAAHRLRSADASRGHGEVRTISQDGFLPECLEASSRYVAVHFYSDAFERCAVLDHHLRRAAARNLGCKFLRIDAERAPFFATKLSIRTLPTLVVFEKGCVLDRLVGFEGLVPATEAASDPDRFKTSHLEAWLGRTGAIDYDPKRARNDDYDEDEDDDTDEDEAAMSRGIRRVQIRHRSSLRPADD